MKEVMAYDLGIPGSCDTISETKNHGSPDFISFTPVHFPVTLIERDEFSLQLPPISCVRGPLRGPFGFAAVGLNLALALAGCIG